MPPAGRPGGGGGGVVHVPAPTVVIPSALNVMPTGDSLTNGNGDTQAVNEGGYRLALGTWMLTSPRGCLMTMVGPNDNGFANGQGKHNGQVGVEISYHITNLPSLLGTWSTDLVLLMIGTNDINNGKTVSATLSQLGTLLAAIRSARPACRVLLSTILDGLDSTFHTGAVSYNAGMPAVVASENSAGGHVTLCDGYSAVGAYDPTYWFDALHLKATGYARFEAMWETEIYNELARF